MTRGLYVPNRQRDDESESSWSAQEVVTREVGVSWNDDTAPFDTMDNVRRAAQASETPMRNRGTLLMLTGPTPGMVQAVDSEGTVIGRGPETNVRIPDSGVSRTHAKVYRDGDRFFVQDLDSLNGTYLRGRAIGGACELEDGDRLGIGTSAVFRFGTHDAVEQRVVLDLYQSAVRDPLTHTHNRRYLDERLRGEWSYATRHGTELAVLIVDLDHFKEINDEHGHEAGDRTLLAISALMQNMIRPEDVLARYGGEEFCIIARGLDDSKATSLAERIRRAVAELTIPWHGISLQLTVSIGVANLRDRQTEESPATLMNEADDALYRAKRAGRNRCST